MVKLLLEKSANVDAKDGRSRTPLYRRGTRTVMGLSVARTVISSKAIIIREIFQNTHQGLKLVNGASFVALDVILDKAYSGQRRDHPPLRSAGAHPAGVRDDEKPPLRGHTARNHPLTPVSTKNRVQRSGPGNRQTSRQDVRPGSAGTGRTRITVANGEAVPIQCDPYSIRAAITVSVT